MQKRQPRGFGIDHFVSPLIVYPHNAIPVVSPSVASLGIKIHLAYLIRTSELAMHGFGFDETEVRVHVAKQRDPFGRNPREIRT